MRTVLSQARRRAVAWARPPGNARQGTPATPNRLTEQDAYAFWIAGFVALAIVAGWMVRHPPPPPQLPRPTAGQLATIVAWLIIAGMVVVVLLTRSK